MNNSEFEEAKRAIDAAADKQIAEIEERSKQQRAEILAEGERRRKAHEATMKKLEAESARKRKQQCLDQLAAIKDPAIREEMRSMLMAHPATAKHFQ